jgi:hypothetical protein
MQRPEPQDGIFAEHRGAHLLLQTRVKTLNGELSAVFKRWYPDL